MLGRVREESRDGERWGIEGKRRTYSKPVKKQMGLDCLHFVDCEKYFKHKREPVYRNLHWFGGESGNTQLFMHGVLELE